MSKLNVNEIEATSTNTNVKVVPKGADATCEIKGTDDATLQLNCSAQSHGVKLKAPANSAGQNYTMILPDNQIAASKLLKVKSITGTGASAVGQLEFADEPPQDITSLNASNLTSGTIPSARMPAIPASAGAALELVSKHTVGSTAVSEVVISISDQDAVYKLIGRNIQLSLQSSLEMEFQNSAGGTYTGGITKTRSYHVSTSTSGAVYMDTSDAGRTMYLSYNDYTSHSFIADFAPKQAQNFMMVESMSPGDASMNSRHQHYATMFYNWQGIFRLRFRASSSSSTIQPNSEFLLYKYRES